MDNRVHRIGLTGPTGSGKGLLSGWLSGRGAAVIDCDRVAREVTAPGHPCLAALAEAFSPTVLRPDGSLDRAALAACAFADAQSCARLNRITHPFILELCRERADAAQAAGRTLIVWDAPTLFESGLDRDCTDTVAVLAPPETRLARIRARDGLDEAAALLRMRAQHDDAFYREHADAVLDNDGTPEELYAKAERWLSCVLS